MAKVFNEVWLIYHYSHIIISLLWLYLVWVLNWTFYFLIFNIVELCFKITRIRMISMKTTFYMLPILLIRSHIGVCFICLIRYINLHMHFLTILVATDR
jgi:hypothetical protein